MRQRPCAFFLAVCALFACLAIASCRKIENPAPSDLKQSGFLFNYKIHNPETKPRRTYARVARHFENGRLIVFSRGDFIPPGVLDSYSRKSGVQVRMALYRTNLEMQERVLAGERFDLIIAAGYMVQILAQRGTLAELNYVNIPNVRHLAPQFRSLPFDPDGRHSVALVWHTFGIAYNARLLDEVPRTWKDLFEPSPEHLPHVAGRSALLASPYRIFAAALLRLGYQAGSENPAEMKAAADYLKRIAPERHFKLVPQDEMASRLSKEEILLATAHSSDVTRAEKTNPDIAFILPGEGTWVSFDNAVVPRAVTSAQKEMAEDFINYLLHPTAAAEIADTSLAASTVPGAAPYLDPAIKFGPSALRPRDGWPALTGDANSTLQEEAYADLVAAQPARK